ncbi:zinc finger protein 32-like isoform X1 [Colias croceus]|uniref:zinc finger protein 32-like isoform X1 n=2 Tax=Colias crocea TaxID=72248 RepID=UPI001E27C037|nr:zinc finger protein 32-like isoform X1 [Colias croceus]
MLPVLLMMNRMSRRRRLVKTQQIEKKPAEKECCRTCLSTENLTAIFVSRDMKKKRSDDLKLVTGLQIQYNDGLSQKMCTKCVEIMKIALKFRNTSRKAQKTLLNMNPDKVIPRTDIFTSKVQKVEVDVLDNDCAYDYYQDDFQNADYEPYEEPKKFRQKPTITKKKRDKIPTATSYKCNTCNKEFRMKATYKAHMRFHTNYCVCESCGKRCRNNNQLQEHKRARHGLGRIHKCAYCEYSSATKEALTIHERRHTGERPYICDHCGATFHRRSNLVQHIAIHLPEKNFQCDMCPKRLKSRKFLQIHKHNAHTGKRYGYLCPVCDHRFEKPNKVRAHTRRVHGLPDDQHGPIVRVQL